MGSENNSGEVSMGNSPINPLLWEERGVRGETWYFWENLDTGKRLPVAVHSGNNGGEWLESGFNSWFLVWSKSRFNS